MPPQIVIVSGPICAGKSSLSFGLSRELQLSRIDTGDLLRDAAKDSGADRASLQRRGDRLDKESDHQWVADGVARLMREVQLGVGFVVDAVRTTGQIDGIRQSFPRRVVHVHLTAPTDELTRRYRRRKRTGEFGSYEEARANPTERDVDQLAGIADIVVQTDRCSEADVLARVLGRLGQKSESARQLVDVMVGGQYGSEGKGNIAAYVADEYGLLVRVGGPNAGHKVFTGSEGPAGRSYSHHLLPSGTYFAPEAKLLLGPGTNISIEQLLKEIADHGIGHDRLSVDPNAVIITDEDRKFERTLKQDIASTGQGVGAATARRVLRHRGFDGKRRPVRMARDVEELRPFVRSGAEVLSAAFSEGLPVFLEGTQGTLLSLYHGPYPYVTSRDTTIAGCLSEAGIAPARVRRTIMVCRTYPIRVKNPAGATSGPLVRPINWEEVARRSGIDATLLRKSERTTTTNRLRRVGEFEWENLRLAAQLNGPTDIAITFADYIDSANGDAMRFEQLSPRTLRFIEEVESVAGAPVTLISKGFSYRNVIDRRSW